MSGGLYGRCALVTGSVQGIGLATAKALVREGASVMLTDIHAPTQIGSIMQDVRSCGAGSVAFHAADLTDAAAIQALVSAAETLLGLPQILVNNAAVRTRESIETISDGDWNLALKVNLTAPFQLIRAALPAMRRTGWGRIVNVSSGFGLIGSPRRIDYVTTKTGMIGLTRAVALDLRFSGITCNAICPGSTWTPRQEDRLQAIIAKERLSREDAHASLLDSLGASHFLPPEQVADAIAYLCSENAGGITGSAIPVDAGDTAGW